MIAMPRQTRTAAFLSLGVILASTGCFWATTKHEGKKMREDIDRIDAQLKSSVQDKVVELQKVLDEATKLLTRNSADIGAEVDELEREGSELRGLVMEAKRLTDGVVASVKEQSERIDALEKRLGELETRVNSEPPKSPDQMFAEAKVVFDSKNYARAADMFKEIVVRYSTSDIAPEAQYYRGEAAFRSEDFKSAIGEFQKVFDKYPDSRRADEALFRAGESAEGLKWCTDARAYYGVLVQRYPKSSLVARAKKKITDIAKIARDKKKCAS